MKKCEKCGADNTDTLAFCTNCGAPLLSSPTPAPAPAPAPAMPETPAVEPAPTPEAPTTPATPAPEAPAPMPAPTVESVAPATPAPSTIPTPTPVNPAQDVKPAGKNNKMVMIILIAVVAIIGVVVAVILIMSNNSGTATPTTTNNTNNNSSNNTETEESSGVITTSTTAGTKVTLGDYVITVPKNLNYELNKDTLYLGDVSEAWMAGIAHNSNVTYANVAPNLDKFATTLEDGGAKVAKSGADTISGQQYSYIDYTENGHMYTIGFFKASNDSTFAAVVSNGTAVADHGLFGITTPIILSAKDASAASKEAETTKTGNGLIKTMHLDDTSAFEQ